MKALLKAVPNILTVLNLTAGVAGILFWQHDLLFASSCIFAALVFDFLDGFLARTLNAMSEIGKQLDSLSDLVSFGVLPAFVLFGVLHPDFLWMSKAEIPLTSYLLFAIPVCSALRLAKFNIDSTQTYGFKGLPTPANAFWIASVPFIVMKAPNDGIAISLFSGQISLVMLALLGSAMLIIPIPLMALKFRNFQWKPNAFRYVLIACSVILFLVFRWQGIPMIIVLYILISLLEKVFIAPKTQS